jgi:ATP/maltotriose-dependent transcriptional regulator MalT
VVVSPRPRGPSVEDADPLIAAHGALARHEWQAAYDAAAPLPASGDDPGREADRLDVRAEAAWWLGRLDECIAARETSYALFDGRDDARRAARCAVWLYEHYCFRAQPTIGAAWLRRARRLLADDVETVEYGNLVLRETEAAHGRGELDLADAQALAILELARRLRSADLEAQALQTRGRVLIDQGRASEGLEHLDEAMLFALEGKLSAYTTGKVYCSLITACEELGDHRRATEWIDATARWSEQHPFALFPGLCRVHHAWALQCRGQWAHAEQEAVHACAQLAGISRVHRAAGFVELGEIRRRLGDLDGAEAAFQEAASLSGRPQAGLALLRLAQGRADAATTIISQALDETWNLLTRAKLLPARVQIALAAGDTVAAAAAVEELEVVARDFDSAATTAAAATARGRLLVAQSEPTRASVELRRALALWHDLDLPYEAATVRVLLGQTCRALGDEEGAEGCLATAEAMFEHLGARLEVRATRELRQRAALPGGLTAREGEVLGLVASGSTNKDIATALHLSEKTVARHLSNIFTKIGVPTRSAATAFAFEHGIASRTPPRRSRPGAPGS